MGAILWLTGYESSMQKNTETDTGLAETAALQNPTGASGVLAPISICCGDCLGKLAVTGYPNLKADRGDPAAREKETKGNVTSIPHSSFQSHLLSFAFRGWNRIRGPSF